MSTRTTKIKYDTTKLKNMILKKYPSYAAFSNVVGEKANVLPKTFATKLLGYYAPTDAEIKAIADIFGISAANAKDLFVPTKAYVMAKQESHKKNGKKTSSKKSSSEEYTVPIDVEAVKKAIEASGMSTTKVCTILGISSSTIANWEGRGRGKRDTLVRVAKLLDVDVKTFIKNDETSQDPGSTASTDKKPEVNSEISFIPIGNTQNIHEIFGIINQNIITLATIIDSHIKEQGEVNAKILSAIDTLKEVKVAVKKAEVTADTSKIPQKPITIDGIKKLAKGYNYKDSYDEYGDKITRMVSIIASKEGLPLDTVFARSYDKMASVYGVMYDQLNKEFKSKHRRDIVSPLELLYDNELFREIFYNDLLADEMLKTYKAK